MPSETFVSNIQQAFNIIQINRESAPSVSLNQARIATEAICKQIYISELERRNEDIERVKVDKMMLGALVRKLHDAQMVPRWVITTLGTIQHFGNLGSHDTGENITHISAERIIPCLSALSSLTTWFSEVYLDDSIQLQIKTLELKQSAILADLHAIDQLEDTVYSLERILLSSIQHIKGMQIYGQNWLRRKQYHTNPHPLREELQFSSKKGIYHLDNGEDVDGFELEQIGNLTGKNALDDRDEEFWTDIDMALSLTSHMEIAQHQIPRLIWVYYTSKHEFLYIAPWRSHRKKRYSDILLTLEFYTGGLPQSNPERVLFWTSPYVDAYGEGLMVSLAAPIYDEDNFLGTIALDLGLDLLCDHLRLNTPPNGFYLLLNNKGEVLGHPYRISSRDPKIYHATEFFGISTEEAQRLFSATKEDKVAMSIGDISYTIYGQDVAQTNWKLYLFTHQA